jgi:hypothetical protein
VFELNSKNISTIDANSNDKFSSFFEIEQVPNSRGLYEFVRWIENGVKTEFALDFEDKENPRQGYTFKQITDDNDKIGDKKRLSDVYLNAITIRPTSTGENKRMDSIIILLQD